MHDERNFTAALGLDTDPHRLIRIAITDAVGALVVRPADVVIPAWLRPGAPSMGQQQFGDRLLASAPFVVIPSVVSGHSWNLIFTAAGAGGCFATPEDELFALDTRLDPLAH